jgi:hypothetical protein
LAIDPVRLGVLLLVIARPRPVQSLFFYWLGTLAAGVPYMLGPLMVMHLTPGFSTFAQHVAAGAVFGNSGLQHFQFGVGVVALLIAALMAVRFRAGQHAYAATPGGTTSTLVAESNTPTATSQALHRTQDAPTEGGSPIRRLWVRTVRGWNWLAGRAYSAWETESPKPALMIGLLSGPPPMSALLVLGTIIASGTAIATQVGIAIAWLFGMFAVVEILLISYLVWPTKTETALRRLHDWVLAHSRQAWIAMFVFIGVVMLAYGMGVVTRLG